MSVDYKEILVKEIDLIQTSVLRMASNSFLLKGWLVSIIAVGLALLPENIDVEVVCLLISVATVCFWYLDAYYLNLEKLYRKKYEWVIQERAKGNVDYAYDLNPYNSKMWLGERKKITTVLSSMLSKSLVPFYGIILIVNALFVLNEVI